MQHSSSAAQSSKSSVVRTLSVYGLAWVGGAAVGVVEEHAVGQVHTREKGSGVWDTQAQIMSTN